MYLSHKSLASWSLRWKEDNKVLSIQTKKQHRKPLYLISVCLWSSNILSKMQPWGSCSWLVSHPYFVRLKKNNFFHQVDICGTHIWAHFYLAWPELSIFRLMCCSLTSHRRFLLSGSRSAKRAVHRTPARRSTPRIGKTGLRLDQKKSSSMIRFLTFSLVKFWFWSQPVSEFVFYCRSDSLNFSVDL